jgi:competence ComEA-like helix-hairpin-helix protein
MFKDLLTLSRKEQRGLLVLVVLLVLMLLLRIGLPFLYPPVDFSQLVTDSLQSSWVRMNEPEAVEADIKALRAFDPNNIDSLQLLAFGLDSRTASNWVKYLEAGGRFYSAEDIGKLYGMSPAWLSAVTPFVDIPQNKAEDFGNKVKAERLVFLDLNRMDSLALKTVGWPNEMVDSVLLWQRDRWFSKRYPKVQLLAWSMDSLLLVREHMAPKYAKYNEQEHFVICINEADTAEWSLLRGVGPVLSRRIVSYRKALGGFVSVEQVGEVYGISPVLFEDIKSFLTLDSIELDVIDVNKASLRRLRNHPYMDFYMAKAIVDARKENGVFTHVDQVALLKGFDNKQWEILKCYLMVQGP